MSECKKINCPKCNYEVDESFIEQMCPRCQNLIESKFICGSCNNCHESTDIKESFFSKLTKLFSFKLKSKH